ncbi:MAG TPA: DNA polymerase III subunit delta [Candidatus Saccharimonadales bacterium]|nr:DNA polymerase III subunit delta [Candidatus Saccharimonadales bacterium]
MITLTGSNGFGLSAELKKLVGNFVAEQGDLALERLDGDEADLARISEALTSLPFLASQKMVVLRGASNNKGFLEQAEQLLSEVPETTEVILVEPHLDKRTSYYKFLKKSTDFREFNELDPNALVNWLVAEAKTKNGQLSSTDARFLVERVGANQQLLSNELEKLLLFDPKITRASIEELTDETPQSSIFNLLEAAFAGNKKRALELYAEQRALKEEPAKIIAMLTWQLNVLAIVKTAGERSAQQIASDAKLNPFVVQKSQNIARKLSIPDLRTKIQELLRIDVASKRTNLDTDEALQHYLLTLA